MDGRGRGEGTVIDCGSDVPMVMFVVEVDSECRGYDRQVMRVSRRGWSDSTPVS